MSQGGWEKEKESPRGMMEPKRRKTKALGDDDPTRFLFLIIAIFIGIPGESLCGGESLSPDVS